MLDAMRMEELDVSTFFGSPTMISVMPSGANARRRLGGDFGGSSDSVGASG